MPALKVNVFKKVSVAEDPTLTEAEAETVFEKVAEEEIAKLVIPEIVVGPAMVPKLPVNVPTPKVTAPVEGRVKVPELEIPPPKV